MLSCTAGAALDSSRGVRTTTPAFVRQRIAAASYTADPKQQPSKQFDMQLSVQLPRPRMAPSSISGAAQHLSQHLSSLAEQISQQVCQQLGQQLTMPRIWLPDTASQQPGQIIPLRSEAPLSAVSC